MKVTGERNFINEFIQMLMWEGSFREQGLGRVFSVDIEDMQTVKISEGKEIVSGILVGDCAWSVHSAMMKESRNGLPSLESESKRLGIAVEAYSEELGCEFQEHYIIVKGKVCISDCVAYRNYDASSFSEEEIAELCKNENITREDFDAIVENNDGYYISGGFGDDFGDFMDLVEFIV